MAKTHQTQAQSYRSDEAQIFQTTARKTGRITQTGDRPRLVLIEPKSPGKHIYSAMKLPRLGAVLLGTIARDIGWDVKVYVEDVADIDYTEALCADLVGISTITSTAPRAYAIADSLREYGVTVAMGGPHVTFLATEALDHCDYVVRGEGEKSFPMLLDAIHNDYSFETIPNLSYRNGQGELCENPMASHIDDLDSLPFPDYSLIVGWTDAKNFSSRPIIPILSSRGCPFGCNFCSVIEMFGRKMRFRSIENITAELENYKDIRPNIFFYDDNFTANRRRAIDLLKETAVRRKLFHSWSAQVRTDVAKDKEVLDLMKQTNCSNVYIGFESANPDTLLEMNKRQSVDDMTCAVKEFNERKIDVHGMFVFGFDNDTPEAIDRTIEFSMKSGILSAQFLILTPLPGTQLYNNLRDSNRIRISDYSLYDGQHVVFEPRHLTFRQLQWAQIRGHARFYSRWRTAKHLVRGYVVGSAIYTYARRLNREWTRNNRWYLKTLDLAERARNYHIQFDFQVDLSEIGEQIRQAAQRLQLSLPLAPVPAG